MTIESRGTGRGYCGRILHVDLSTSKISCQELDEAFYQKYFGGVWVWEPNFSGTA